MAHRLKIYFFTSLLIGFLLEGKTLFADLESFSICGFAVDQSETAVEGQKSVTYRLYNSESGGSPLWQETQTTSFDQGVFCAGLGENTGNPLPLSQLLTEARLFLGIQIESDSELSPRLEFFSSPFALIALSVADGGTIQGATIEDSELKGTTTVQFGGSTATGQPSFTVHVNTTTVSTAGIGQTDLMTYTLPANSLNVDGKALRITAWGTAEPNPSLKIKCQFGGTEIVNTVRQGAGLPFGGMSSSWWMEAVVVRTGGSSQSSIARIWGDCVAPNACAPQYRMDQTSPSENLSSGLTIKCIGEQTAAVETIRQLGLIVQALN